MKADMVECGWTIETYATHNEAMRKIEYDLDHLCRVRHCVNPAHLEPVTRQENLLRGQTTTASNAAKTHCPKGHAFIGNNIKMNSGSRKCRTCENAYTRQWRATQRLAYV